MLYSISPPSVTTNLIPSSEVPAWLSSSLRWWQSPHVMWGSFCALTTANTAKAITCNYNLTFMIYSAHSQQPTQPTETPSIIIWLLWFILLTHNSQHTHWQLWLDYYGSFCALTKANRNTRNYNLCIMDYSAHSQQPKETPAIIIYLLYLILHFFQQFCTFSKANTTKFVITITTPGTTIIFRHLFIQI